MKMQYLPIFAALLILVMPMAAQAACSNPSGVEGQIIFNETSNVPAYCDNTNWIAMSGGNPSPSTDYIPNSVLFDGSVSINNSSLTAPNSKMATISFWMKRNTLGSEQEIIDTNGGNDHDITWESNNALSIVFSNSSNTDIFSVSLSNPATTDTTNWHHYLLSFDLTDTNKRHFYVDGVAVAPTYSIYTDDTIRFNGLTYHFGRDQGGSQNLRAEVLDFWFDTDTYIDLSIQSNREKFFSAIGDAVYLGYNGDLPTGTPPEIFLSGDASNWNQNKGTGGTFNVENGPLTNSTISPFAEQTKIVPSGLIGHWRLDETSGSIAYDSSGFGRHASYGRNIGGWTRRGVVDRAIETDENQSITVTDPAFDNLSAFSLCYWIKQKDYPSGSSGHDPISKPNAFQIQGYRTSTSNNFRKYGWNTVDFDKSGFIFKDTDWRHHCVTFDETLSPDASKIYTNGQLTTSGTSGAGTSQNDSGTTLRFGINSYQHIYFDDLRFYNRAITLDEVKQIHGARDGLRYNQNQRTYEFFNQIDWVSMTPNWEEPNPSTNGYEPYAVGFGGTNEWLTTTGFGIASPLTTVSGSFWVYRSASGLGTNQPIIFTEDLGGDGYFRVRFNTSNQIAIDGRDAGGATFDTFLNSTNTIIDDGWHHVLFSIDVTNNTLQNLYVDDVNVLNSTGQTDAEFGADIDRVNIGAEGSTGNNRFHGRLSDIWVDFGNFIDFSNTAIRRKFIDNLGNPVDLAVDGSRPTGSAPDVFLSGATASWHTNKGAGTGFTEDGALTDSSFTGLYGDLVGHWKLDETEGTTAIDATGSNNGTMNGSMSADTNSTPAAVGTGLTFDGNDDHIIMGDIFDFGTNQNFTVSAWIKAPNGAGGGIIASKRDGGVGWWIGMNAANGNLDAQLDNGGTITRLLATSDYRDNTWHLITATYDRGGNINLYVDGALEDTIDISSEGVSLSTANNFVIGANSTGATAFFGEIDDVRVYDRVLIPTEIQKLYQMGAPVGQTTALPQGCPNIGDVCDDGTIYAGLSPDGNIEMYTTPCNWQATINNGSCTDGQTIGWGSSGNRNFIGTTNNNTGEDNTNTLVISDASSSSNFQNHNAAQRCYDLAAHGADDWYLPSSNEYQLYYINRAVIGGFGTQQHWTSTEVDANSALRKQFSNGASVGAAKSNGFYIRCVRKGPAPRCANPYGLEGQMLYNNVENVVQYCDGARWIAIGKY